MSNGAAPLHQQATAGSRPTRSAHAKTSRRSAERLGIPAGLRAPRSHRPLPGQLPLALDHADRPDARHPGTAWRDDLDLVARPRTEERATQW